MIDRRSREEMCAAIRDYMAERITAFELDYALDRLACSSQDRTLSFVRKLMWFHYDDCRDHSIVATKQKWDYFNRLLFLLESDAEGEFVRTRGTLGAGWRNLFQKKQPSAIEIATTPFLSVSSILSLRRKMKGFGRVHYPRKLTGSRVRHPVEEVMMSIWGGILAVILSPIIFVGLMLPLNQFEPRIKIPRQ